KLKWSIRCHLKRIFETKRSLPTTRSTSWSIARDETDEAQSAMDEAHGTRAIDINHTKLKTLKTIADLIAC
ncbi:hypothetical protein TorRG33x02_254080, partial [Trema orientale]